MRNVMPSASNCLDVSTKLRKKTVLEDNENAFSTFNFKLFEREIFDKNWENLNKKDTQRILLVKTLLFFFHFFALSC